MAASGRKLAPRPEVESGRMIQLVPVEQRPPVVMVLGLNGQLLALQPRVIPVIPVSHPSPRVDSTVRQIRPAEVQGRKGSSPMSGRDTNSLSSQKLSPTGRRSGGGGDVMLSTMTDTSSSSASFSVQSLETPSESREKLSLGFRDPASISASLSRDLSASSVGKSGKGLECPFCGKEFSRSFSYSVHLRQHTGQKPYQCMICGRAFSQNSNVKKHIETHKVWPHEAAKPADRGPVAPPEVNSESILHFESASQTTILQQKCPYCDEVTDTTGILRKHLASKHKTEKMFQCPLRSCRVLMSDLTTTLHHVKGHEGSLVYHCPHCEKEYLSLRDVGIHQHTHVFHGLTKHPRIYNRTYQCFGCGEQYRSLENLERHQSHVSHVFPCPFNGCHKNYPNQRRLRRHIKTHYPMQYKFPCNLCSKKFPFKSSLKTHMLTHSVESHQCYICKKKFRRKDVLQRHIVTSHRNCPLYICTFGGCGRNFKRKDHLKAHILLHTKPQSQKIKCPVHSCGKLFKRERWMLLHKAADHDGIRPFRCPHCNQGFRRKETLSLHQKRCPTPHK